jgi:hypothetical protein
MDTGHWLSGCNPICLLAGDPLVLCGLRIITATSDNRRAARKRKICDYIKRLK